MVCWYGVIAKVEGPSAWCAGMVIVPKKVVKCSLYMCGSKTLK